MFSTDEARWFFKGSIPASILVWFAAQDCVTAVQPARVDYYLRLNRDDTLGIKLREGRIEVKQRTHPGEFIRFSEQTAGVAESWRKWSFGLAVADENVTESTQWVGVWKSRRWCLFEMGADGRFLPNPVNAMPEQGCACEMTQVRLMNTSEMWWTLGFEAFGAETGRRDRLLLVAKLFLEQANAPVLTVKNSYSYPTWLHIAGN